MKLHEQRTLQTHRHAMFALDVSQINWRTTVAHLPTEDRAVVLLVQDRHKTVVRLSSGGGCSVRAHRKLGAGARRRSIVRTLARLTRSRGAKRGANSGRYQATPGHV